MTHDEPELADEVWRPVAGTTELDESTAALIERCVRAALRTARAMPGHTDN